MTRMNGALHAMHSFVDVQESEALSSGASCATVIVRPSRRTLQHPQYLDLSEIGTMHAIRVTLETGYADQGAGDFELGQLFQPAVAGSPGIRLLAELDAMLVGVRENPGATACVECVAAIASKLPEGSQYRYAAFKDDDGTVSILGHNGSSKRQLSLEFSEDGKSVEVVCIDAAFKRTSTVHRHSDWAVLLDDVRWLGAK